MNRDALQPRALPPANFPAWTRTRTAFAAAIDAGPGVVCLVGPEGSGKTYTLTLYKLYVTGRRIGLRSPGDPMQAELDIDLIDHVDASAAPGLASGLPPGIVRVLSLRPDALDAALRAQSACRVVQVQAMDAEDVRCLVASRCRDFSIEQREVSAAAVAELTQSSQASPRRLDRLFGAAVKHAIQQDAAILTAAHVTMAAWTITAAHLAATPAALPAQRATGAAIGNTPAAAPEAVATISPDLIEAKVTQAELSTAVAVPCQAEQATPLVSPEPVSVPAPAALDNDLQARPASPVQPVPAIETGGAPGRAKDGVPLPSLFGTPSPRARTMATPPGRQMQTRRLVSIGRPRPRGRLSAGAAALLVAGLAVWVASPKQQRPDTWRSGAPKPPVPAQLAQLDPQIALPQLPARSYVSAAVSRALSVPAAPVAADLVADQTVQSFVVRQWFGEMFQAPPRDFASAAPAAADEPAPHHAAPPARQVAQAVPPAPALSIEPPAAPDGESAKAVRIVQIASTMASIGQMEDAKQMLRAAAAMGNPDAQRQVSQLASR